MVEKVKQKRKGLSLSFLSGGVSSAQLVVFVRQFATMIDAGLPLVQCLEILSSQEPSKYFKSVLLVIQKQAMLEKDRYNITYIYIYIHTYAKS